MGTAVTTPGLQKLRYNSVSASLTSAFGPLEEAQPAAKPEGDAALLNGPQREKNAASQTDIDALFASLG